MIRNERNSKLSLSDWTQIIADFPLSNRLAWQEYRQALRDVPKQAGFPNDVIWPKEPVAVSGKMPMVITMRQARLALLSYGLLDDVEAVIITMNEPQRSQTQIEWEYAQTVERDNALVAALGPALGLDDAAIDSLFTLAATL
jgi:hypothetical protein